MYIARNRDNGLRLFEHKPTLYKNGEWWCESGKVINLKPNQFESIRGQECREVALGPLVEGSQLNLGLE